MSGGDLGTGFTGLALMYGGAMFARMGWRNLRRPAQLAASAQELAPPPPGTSLPWKALWLFVLLFGAFVLVCGLFLALSIVLPE